MAAGRHGGYRDDEFRGRESDSGLSRVELGYTNGDYDRVRNNDGELERGRVLDRSSRDRGRREMINGGYRSASSRSDSGSSGSGERRKDGFAVRDVDREPGELSSDSGSEVDIDSESLMNDGKAKKLENGNQSIVDGKKRIFSPIIWDRDDNNANRISKSRNTPVTSKLRPQPPLPKSSNQGVNPSSDRVVLVSPDNNAESKETLLLDQNTAPGSRVDTAPESLDDAISLPSRDEELRGNDQGATILEEDEYEPVRTIRSSRWATGADSPADEGEISDDDQMPQLKKRRLVSQSSELGGWRKSLTPELGELKKDGSGGNRARSSESDEHIRSSSRDSYQDNDLEKNDYMDVDKDGNSDGSASQSDSESEGCDSHGTPEPVLPPQRSVSMLKGCRNVHEFEKLNQIDEGTYGVVYRARDKKTGEIVALKKVKMEKEREGFPLTSLREINILLSFHHPSIVDVKEVVVGSSLDSVFMVMEYMEHDLKALMETKKQPYSQSEVKCLMLQLFEGVEYLHDNWVLHRDLKTSNLLLNNRGELKICDFGLSRQYGSPLKPYTSLVVTLWYRAPELLLGAKQYSTAIDMWSLGCIMAELLSTKPLFNGKTEFDQLDKVFRILGTPNETIWPGFSKLPRVKLNFVKHPYNQLRKIFPATSFTGSPVLSEAGFDLLNKLLTYDPEKRITAAAALKHEWFREVPFPKSKEFMPTFPAHHAEDRRVRRVMKNVCEG